jgi:hypothetical protein
VDIRASLGLWSAPGRLQPRLGHPRRSARAFRCGQWAATNRALPGVTVKLVDERGRARKGFDQARTRLETAYEAEAPARFDLAFIAIAEAIMWAMALDDALITDAGYEAFRAEHPDGRCVIGAGLARNVAVHELIEVAEEGEEWSYSRSHARRYAAWRWLPADELPPRTQPQRRGVEDSYATYLAGRNVERILRRMAEFFAAAYVRGLA